MKTLYFILALFVSTLVAGQNPYARPNNEFRKLFDPIPVDKRQEQKFFNYAIKLFEQDTLRKAGQIFDRFYWLDTSSSLGTQALLYRKKIEQKIILQTQDNLNNSWNSTWSGKGWGINDSSEASQNKRLQLDGNTIKFYLNDSLARQTNYVLTQRFDWVNGFLINHVRYCDTNEEWYFNLAPFGRFTSDVLSIEKKSNQSHGYGEAYILANKTKANNNFMQ